MGTKIRPERPTDIGRIREIHLAAFPTPFEADLVDALRGDVEPWRSFVAEHDGRVVGHVLYTPVTLDPAPGRPLTLVGLGPMAVDPDEQNQGIGSALADASLADVGRDVDAVVVLGHPEWYPRFGFKPASRYGLSLALDAPGEAFLALEAIDGVLMDIRGTVHYHPRFSDAPA